jgi:hypothetical protein
LTATWTGTGRSFSNLSKQGLPSSVSYFLEKAKSIEGDPRKSTAERNQAKGK